MSELAVRKEIIRERVEGECGEVKEEQRCAKVEDPRVREGTEHE